MAEEAALAATAALGVPYEVVLHGPVRTLEEAAQVRGVDPAHVADRTDPTTPQSGDRR